MLCLGLFGTVLLCRAVQSIQPRRVVHQLNFRDIELIVLFYAASNSRSRNMVLITMKIPYSILQIANSLVSVTRVAQEIRIVDERAHCSLAVNVDVWTACKERKDRARQTFGFLASMLLESGKTL